MDANRKILIVDDQEDLRQQVAKMLQQRVGQNDTSSLIEQIRSRISKTKEVTTQNPVVSYSVDTVGQGRDAYDMVKKSFSQHEPYALMFLDMRMPPGWDGLETAQRIRSIDKEIQIVIMTAYADYEQQEIAEKIGEPDKLLYIKKPFHSEEIRQLALAMTEKWNMNRREKERLILTNRLMRENSYLTRYRFKNMQDTYRTVLNAFVSFLDARIGVLARRQADKHFVCASSATPEAAKKLIAGLDRSQKEANRVLTLESNGSAFVPLSYDGFDGYLYVEGKNLVFPFEQLQPFLEILMETTREVLINSSLHQQQSEEKQLAAVGLATSKIAARVNDAILQINGATNTLSRCENAGTRAKLIATILEATGAVSRLTREIQTFSDDQYKDLQLDRHNIKDVLAKSLQRFADPIMEQGISVITELETDLVITCDAIGIARVLDTLLQNAMDAFTRSGATTRELKVSASYLDNYRNAIQVVIEDTAGGILDDVLGRVFEPFRSSDPEHHNGLGTTIAKQILDRHNGVLNYESEAGTGTRFQVILPVSPETPFNQTVSGKLT